MIGEDEEDTALLLNMLEEARRYVLSFSWCKSIVESHFGAGVGGVIAIFLFRIEPARPDVDEWLWVVVGDVPSAYLVIDSCKTPAEALRGYIGDMRKWVELAKQGQSSKNVIPVNVPATPEWAAELEGRLNLIEEVILPTLSQLPGVRISNASERTQ